MIAILRCPALRRRLALGVSGAALLAGSAMPLAAATLQSSYSPAANNGGGAAPGRADIITLNGQTDTINGAYDIGGTSAGRFAISRPTFADRQAAGEIVSGYDAIAGRNTVPLTAEQRTAVTTYPDTIRGTNVSVNVYDNAKLIATDTTAQQTTVYRDTGAPVYGDLRLADIAGSNVTIATGTPAASIYDRSNFALLNADSGSTLYNVTGGSTITYASRTATMSGRDQDGLVQRPQQSFPALVTAYSGIAFGNGDAVTDAASLRRYNTALIAQLNAGTITPTRYEQLMQAAAVTSTRDVVVRQADIPQYAAPPTQSQRLFMRLDGSRLTTTALSELVGVSGSTIGRDGGSTLILAQNGSTVVNNGRIVTAEEAPGIILAGAGTSLANTTTGVIGVGYEVLDRSGTTPVPSGISQDIDNYATNNVAVLATGGATVVNQGIVNVGNRDIAGAPQAVNGKANVGIVVGSGATASNQGTILIGGAASNASNALGSYRGAGGMVALAGGTATNAAGGTIRVGTSFAENAADLAAVTDVRSVNYANGMTALDGGTLVNNGAIRIGGLAQNANGILVGGGSTATNAGRITIDATAVSALVQTNAAIAVIGHSGTGIVDATNVAGGRIDVNAVNSAGLLVRNTVNGGSARAENYGTIAVAGGLSVDRLRSYAVFVDGASSSALQNGAVLLTGEGAIGVHARNGGVIDVGQAATLDFGGTGEIGYYLLGAGSRINFSSAAAPTAVTTAGSTGVRVEGGATLGGTGVNLTVGGAGATGIVASGASSGTTLDTTGATIVVSGAGATGVRVEGGATGMLGGTIALAGSGTIAAVVDGQGYALDGTPNGTPVATTQLTSASGLTSGSNQLTGYIARNQGRLVNTGNITFDGSGVTGLLVQSGGSATNSGAVRVASGTGVAVDGTGSSYTGNGALTAANGTAALALTNGGSATTAAAITGGGTAHGVLLGTGAGALTLGAGTVTTTGSGNGIENVAGSSVRLNGTTIVAAGSGSGVRTAVNLDPASTGTITASGAGSTGLTFAGTGGAVTTGDAALPAGVAITATGAGANGVRLATTGNATLSGTIAVTAANGGSALIGGPAASITNAGTLRSASTAAPVVDLTGGTRAFTNTGTIAAPSAGAVAILGGNGGQQVTLSNGAVTGAIRLGSGNDTFVMSGGTLTGSLDTGAGNDSATFRNLTDANLSGVTRIAGAGVAGGSDTLTFDNTRSTGTRRISGFNTVALVNGSTLTADGDLSLATGGQLSVGSGTTYFAGAGVRSAVIGSVVNAGTIDLTNGTSGAADTLTVRGNYAGNGGTLRIDTVLGATGPSDRLVIDGGTVTGTTAIVVANAGGLGARTTGNGIEVVTGINGAVTTATTTRSGFVLAGGHVDAGAYQYRLFASDAQGSQNWYLRTDAADGGPAYRPEVALLSGLPQQLRHQDLDMLGTYHQRMGDKTGEVADGFSMPGRLWGRAIYDSYNIRNRNAGRSDYDGRAYGFQAGVDLFEFGSGAGHHDVGIYGGYLDGRASVRGFAGGLNDQYVGRTNPRTAYLGGYWTYLANSGFYVDTVVQHSWYNGHGLSADNNRFDIDGTGVLASVETGYAIRLSPRFAIEPQAQIVGQGISLDGAAIPNAFISQKTEGTLTGRLGVRLVGTMPIGTRTIQPYVRANIWKQFASTDRTIFASGGTNTVFDTRVSSFYGQAGAGLTLPIAANFALYGEGDYRFTLDNGNSVRGHAVNGSIGARLRF